jgi:hypothetical protein
MDIDQLKRRHRLTWAAMALAFAVLVAAPDSTTDYLIGPFIVAVFAGLVYVLVLRHRMRRELARMPGSAPAERSLTTVLVIAAVVGLFDVFFAGQSIWSWMLCAVALVYYLPRALFAMRDRPRMKVRFQKALGVFMVGLASALVVRYDMEMQQRNVDSIIAAVRSYQAAQGKYPPELQSLVPAYLPELPRSRLAASANRFWYFPDAQDPSLMYVVFPPFGRKSYHFGSERWSQID